MKHGEIPAISSPAGYINIVSVWEFLRNVRKEYCQKFYEDVTVLKKDLYGKYHSQYNGLQTAEVLAESTHLLVQNPMKLLTELKKTTTKKTFTRSIGIQEFIWEMTTRSLTHMGEPTHMFNIGENTYAVVAQEDVRLFVKDSMHQQLVCTRPERNFHIIAKNLRFEL